MVAVLELIENHWFLHLIHERRHHATNICIYSVNRPERASKTWQHVQRVASMINSMLIHYVLQHGLVLRAMCTKARWEAETLSLDGCRPKRTPAKRAIVSQESFKSEPWPAASPAQRSRSTPVDANAQRPEEQEASQDEPRRSPEQTFGFAVFLEDFHILKMHNTGFQSDTVQMQNTHISV